MSDSQSNFRPTEPPLEEPRPIQEIVSPVQPEKGQAGKNIITIFTLLVATFALGYVVYGRWPSFGGGIKIAKAPEMSDTTVPGPADQLGAVVLPAPALGPTSVSVIPPTETESEAEPRISSISTNTPNVAVAETNPTQPEAQVLAAAASAGFVYTDVSGFTISLPAGSHVATVNSEDRIIEFRDTSKKLLGKIVVATFLLDGPADLGSQLALSSNIQNVQPTTFQGLLAYKYTHDGQEGMAVIRGTRVYYITNYSKQFLATLVLK